MLTSIFFRWVGSTTNLGILFCFLFQGLDPWDFQEVRWKTKDDVFFFKTLQGGPRIQLLNWVKYITPINGRNYMWVTGVVITLLIGITTPFITIGSGAHLVGV